MKANLHVHSTYSDGTKNINEINKLAIENGFNYVAITDHDTVDAKEEIDKLKTSVKFLIGVEMSCKYKNEVIHILGYFKNSINDTVKEYFEKSKKIREDRCFEIIKNLKDYYDIEITYESVLKKADGLITRAHIAEAIMDKYDYDMDYVFDNFIGDDAKAFVPYDVISLKDAINFLKENGALVVLAHPVLIKKFDFKEILDFGFDGIEVYHPDQDENYSNMLNKIAKEKDLFITGGSDYHGDITTHTFGQNYIQDKDLEIFLNKLS